MGQVDEALDLKRRARRRLIGAIALVLFLVIVPPWIMDLEPKPVETTLEVEIPKPDSRPLPEPPRPEAKAPPAQPAAPEAAADTAPERAPEAAAAPEPAPAVKAEAEPKREAKTAEGKTLYVVPVATLSDKGNVKELQARISLAGIESYTEAVKGEGGARYTRVRAGPFASKDEAEKVRKRLLEMGLKPGNVTTR